MNCGNDKKKQNYKSENQKSLLIFKRNHPTTTRLLRRHPPPPTEMPSCAKEMKQRRRCSERNGVCGVSLCNLWTKEEERLV